MTVASASGRIILPFPKQWLEKAFKLGDPQKIRLMSLDGPDHWRNPN